jgi:hypothetical protein
MTEVRTHTRLVAHEAVPGSALGFGRMALDHDIGCARAVC